MRRILVHICIFAILFIGCSDAPDSGGRAVQIGTLDRSGTALPVEIIEVQEEDVAEWIHDIGSIYADKRVTLSAEVGGKVAEIRAEMGDQIAAGDLLARLDDERSRIAREKALADVEIAKANLENSQREAEREANLFEDQITSEHSIDRARLKAEIDAGQLKAARAALAAAERNLSDSQIVSPIDGEIVQRHIEVGELVQPGTPLFDIVNIDRVKVTIQVSERDITAIRDGQDAEISVDGYPGMVFHGSVSNIGAAADDQTRTFPVEISVVNDRPEKLLPGFIGRVRIRGRTFKNAVSLPEEVIVEREERPVVFVVGSDTVSARTVELGYAHRGKVIVREGLRPGDKVVVTGQQSLRDGAKVSVR